MNIDDIVLRGNPSHGAVKRVSRIVEDWMMLKLGISGFRKFAESKQSGISIQKLFESTPELMIDFVGLQDSLGEYQTIMLATGWNIKQMIEFEEEATDDEYKDLLGKCIEVLGGTAADFFGSSPTGSNSPQKPKRGRPSKKV